MTLTGFDNLDTTQQNDFTRILNKYLSAQGDDMRKNLVVKSVKPTGKDFEIQITRYGKPSCQILHPSSGGWS